MALRCRVPVWRGPLAVVLSDARLQRLGLRLRCAGSAQRWVPVRRAATDPRPDHARTGERADRPCMRPRQGRPAWLAARPSAAGPWAWQADKNGRARKMPGRAAERLGFCAFLPPAPKRQGPVQAHRALVLVAEAPREGRPLRRAGRSGAHRCAPGQGHYMPMSPMPPMPPGMPPAAGASSFGASATMASVVSSSEATEAAFCRAVRVTLVGSRMPSSSMSP